MQSGPNSGSLQEGRSKHWPCRKPTQRPAWPAGLTHGSTPGSSRVTRAGWLGSRSPDGGFRARSGEPLNLTAEGNTADAALQHLRDLIAARIAAGSKLTTLSVPSAERTTIHPGAGMYVGDPLFDQWRAEIEAYRQQIEDDPNIP